MFKKFAAQLLDEIADDCDKKKVSDPYKRAMLDDISEKLTEIIQALVESEGRPE